MSVLEAIIMGILQGLTEFLPVSSSGHLELANVLFGIEGESNLQFTMAVHFATVLSTITVFWKPIGELLRGVFRFRMNDETRYVLNIIVSMIPIGLVGLFLSFMLPMKIMEKKDNLKLKNSACLTGIALFLVVCVPTIDGDAGTMALMTN